MDNNGQSTDSVHENGQRSEAAHGRPVGQTEAAAKRMLFAGVGAFAAACDSAAQTFDRFADRGERVAQQLEQKAEEVRDPDRDVRARFRHYVRNAMDAFLETIDIPSKTDVDAIQLKLNVLNRKLDDLQMQSGREPFVPPEQSAAPGEDLVT